MESNKVFDTQHFMNRRRKVERSKKIEDNKKPSENYKYEINAFLDFCKRTHQLVDYNSMLDYLDISVSVEKIKIKTWDKRLYAIKKYIEYHKLDEFTKSIKDEVSEIRGFYKDEENYELIRSGGKKHMDKNELLKMINTLEVRERAICLVNLVTACRPSEMVRIQLKHFDFDSRDLNVYLKKQKTWVHKRIDLETIKALQQYKDKYDLNEESYLIGRVGRYGHYTSVKVTEHGYRKMLKRWTGVSPYTFRKTQVVHMHTMGADLTTIAVQTGHKDTKTISDHYLNVSNKKIDKFL